MKALMYITAFICLVVFSAATFSSWDIYSALKTGKTIAKYTGFDASWQNFTALLIVSWLPIAILYLLSHVDTEKPKITQK